MQLEKRCFIVYRDQGPVDPGTRGTSTMGGRRCLYECENAAVAGWWLAMVFPRMSKGRALPTAEVFAWADYAYVPLSALAAADIRDQKSVVAAGQEIRLTPEV